MNNNNNISEDNICSLQQTMLDNKEELENLNENINTLNENISESLSLQGELFNRMAERPTIQEDNSGLKDTFKEFQKALKEQTKVIAKYIESNSGERGERGHYGIYNFSGMELIKTSDEMKEQYRKEGLDFLMKEKLSVETIKTGLASVYKDSKKEEWNDIAKKRGFFDKGGDLSNRSKLDRLLDEQIKYYEKEEKQLEKKIKADQKRFKSVGKDKKLTRAEIDVKQQKILEEMESKNRERENLKKDSSNIRDLKNARLNYNGKTDRVEFTPQKNNAAKLEDGEKSEKPKQTESEKLKQTETENKKIGIFERIMKFMKGNSKKNGKGGVMSSPWALLVRVLVLIGFWLHNTFPNLLEDIKKFFVNGWRNFVEDLKTIWHAISDLFPGGEKRREERERKEGERIQREKIDKLKKTGMTMSDGRTYGEHFEEEAAQKARSFFSNEGASSLKINTINGSIGEPIPEKSLEEISAERRHKDDIKIQKETVKEIKQSVSSKGDTNMMTNNYISIPRKTATEGLFK
jgi:hypothetical protein